MFVVMQHFSNIPTVENKPHLAHKITMNLSESCTVLKTATSMCSNNLLEKNRSNLSDDNS